MTSMFAEKVHAFLRKVPKGKVTTYKELANAMGTRAYQAIGQVMRTNPYAPRVPCHRVVASDGSIGGFRGEWQQGKEVMRKVVLLKREGVTVKSGKVRDFERKLCRF
ncbi:MGMT family protein [Candidatus Woesearchaeota archaeon]|nr:MGMT family protein [Candidatus Woesearchaeota archaeon]